MFPLVQPWRGIPLGCYDSFPLLGYAGLEKCEQGSEIEKRNRRRECLILGEKRTSRFGEECRLSSGRPRLLPEDMIGNHAKPDEKT